MSRRKQANPKPIKDDTKSPKTCISMNQVEQTTLVVSGLNEELIQDTAMHETKNFEDDASRKSRHSLDDTKSSFDDEIDPEIDVENISDTDDDTDVNNGNSSTWSGRSSDSSSLYAQSHEYAPSSPLPHTLSPDANKNRLITNTNLTSSQVYEKTQVSPTHHHPKFNSTSQRSVPIVVNGKKYYPLLFNCPDCGVRYSDKGTLLTHQQNYCSKRLTNAEAKITDENIRKPNKSTDIDKNNNECNKNSTSDVAKSARLENNQNDIIMKNTAVAQPILLPEPKAKSPTHDITASANENRNDPSNLVKTEIYQCNHCLFTTDKKALMNKHSRVHLPQKRKAMEDLNSSHGANEAKQDDHIDEDHDRLRQHDTNPNQILTTQSKNQSYCTECEIQFSSMKTFLHHKTHYCQKYKTIEAVLPACEQQQPQQTAKQLDMELSHTIRSAASKQDNCEQQTQRIAMQTVFKSSEPISVRQQDSNKTSVNLPLQSKRIGDVVYVPVYITSPVTTIQSNQTSSECTRLSSSSLVEGPLDLSIGADVEQMSNDAPSDDSPLDLSTKFKKPQTGASVDQLISETLSSNACKLCKINFSSQFALKTHKCQSAVAETTRQVQSDLSIKVLFKCKLCMNEPQFNTQDSYIQHLTDYHSSQTVIMRKTPNEQPASKTIPVHQPITSSSQANSKHFYVCTTCGYRGNTIRGVKQHGKLHLSNNEPFNIAGLTDDELNMLKSQPIKHSLSENENELIVVRGYSRHQLPLQDVSSSSINDEPINNNEMNKIKRIKYPSTMINDLYENNSSTKPIGYFCDICDIKFQHEQNFSAHKKFYCKEKH